MSQPGAVRCQKLRNERLRPLAQASDAGFPLDFFAALDFAPADFFLATFLVEALEASAEDPARFLGAAFLAVDPFLVARPRPFFAGADAARSANNCRAASNVTSPASIPLGSDALVCPSVR